jgi:hypothetical protein
MFVERLAPVLQLKKNVGTLFFGHPRIEPIPSIGERLGPVFRLEEVAIDLLIKRKWLVLLEFLLEVLHGSATNFAIIGQL